MNKFLFRGYYSLISFLFFFCLNVVKAQQPALSVTSINLNDTIYEGTSYPALQATVLNLSNAVFNDSLVIYMQQDTTLQNPDILYSGMLTITPGATSTIQIPLHFFTTQFYKAGGNTVVVWPVSSSAITLDSLHDYFYYVTGTGIAENGGNSDKPEIFPNPVNADLHIAGKIIPFEVRIFNFEGRMVYDEPFKNRSINVNALVPGIYFVECRFKNSRSFYTKIIKR